MPGEEHRQEVIVLVQTHLQLELHMPLYWQEIVTYKLLEKHLFFRIHGRLAYQKELKLESSVQETINVCDGTGTVVDVEYSRAVLPYCLDHSF